MEGKGKKPRSITSSQLDWEKFWGQTVGSFRSSGLGEKGWQLLTRYSSRGCLRLLKDAKRINSILELGGGSGCVSGFVARGLGLKGEALTLIDSSLGAKRAWEQLSGFGTYVLDDFFTHDFKGLKFDLVFSDGLIEHWAERQDRLSVIKKHSELSKKYVMIRVPRKGLGMKILRMKEGAREDGSYEKHYTSEELRQEIFDAGLRVLGVDEDLFATAALAEII